MVQSLNTVAWLKNAGSAVVSICGVASFFLGFSYRTPDVPSLSPFVQIHAVLDIGLLAAIGHGVLWSITELIAKWDFRAGGTGRLPQGRSAIFLSLSLTLPIMIAPVIFDFVTHIPVLPPNHWPAALVVMILGATAHLIMYGIGPKSFRGIRELIVPAAKRNPSWHRVIAMEFFYTLVYFGLISLPYRVVVESFAPSFSNTLVARTILPGLAFFAAMAVLILLRPTTIKDRPGAEMRGTLSGIFLPVCLCTGMFL